MDFRVSKTICVTTWNSKLDKITTKIEIANDSGQTKGKSIYSTHRPTSRVKKHNGIPEKGRKISIPNQ